MPTISRASLEAQLVNRTRDAMRAADANNDGDIDAGERSLLPDDVRPLADSTADYYLSGGPMSISQYVAAYADYVRSALDDADGDGDGELRTAEQSRLPNEIYRSVLALRTAPPPAPPAPPVTPPAPPATTGGAGVLGISGTMGPSRVSLRNVVTSGLNEPAALAFDPRTNKLWIVNTGDDSTVIVSNATGASPSKRKLYDDSNHFLNNPMGIAFSPVHAEMATAGDSTNDYNQGGTGNMFTGPTLWPSDASFTGGASSHLDMLHHSPQAMGIAAGTEYAQEREYWVFNGQAGSVDRYLFGAPHAPGADDHSDGITIRYGSGLQRVAGVPSGMALDSSSGILYVADSGNGRIASLDTKVSVRGAYAIGAHHAETPLYRTDNGRIDSVTSASSGLRAPSGLVLHDGHLVVADHADGHVKVFTKDGALVGDLDTGLGANAVTGIAVGPNGKLFVADKRSGRVVELTIT